VIVYRFEARAKPEGIIADARDTIGDGNRRKARAIIEGIIADAKRSFFNRIRTRERILCFDQMLSYIKNAVFPIRRVVIIPGIIEGRRADARYTIGEGDRRQARATREGIIADARDTIGDGD